MFTHLNIIEGHKINCHLSEQIGKDGLASIVGNNFKDVKFHSKKNVVTLANTSNTVKIENQKLMNRSNHLQKKTSMLEANL